MAQFEKLTVKDVDLTDKLQVNTCLEYARSQGMDAVYFLGRDIETDIVYLLDRDKEYIFRKGENFYNEILATPAKEFLNYENLLLAAAQQNNQNQ